jgi:hypothetical protein
MEWRVVLLCVGLLAISVYSVTEQTFEAECVPDTLYIPSETNYPYLLGETMINITVYTQPNRKQNSGSEVPTYSFINLHENENTSVVAAKTLIYQKGGGSIVFLQHGGTRDITFEFQGTSYTIDPNRMFTWAGKRLENPLRNIS